MYGKPPIKDVSRTYNQGRTYAIKRAKHHDEKERSGRYRMLPSGQLQGRERRSERVVGGITPVKSESSADLGAIRDLLPNRWTKKTN